jgi:hypothetical protein
MRKVLRQQNSPFLQVVYRILCEYGSTFGSHTFWHEPVVLLQGLQLFFRAKCEEIANFVV